MYRQDVVSLQTRCAAADSPPPLAGIRHQLAPWQVRGFRATPRTLVPQFVDLCKRKVQMLHLSNLSVRFPPQDLLLPLHRMLFQHGSAAAEAAAGRGSGLPDGVRLVAAVRAAAAGCGAPQLASALQRLAWHADQTLFRQLSAWCAL